VETDKTKEQLIKKLQKKIVCLPKEDKEGVCLSMKNCLNLYQVIAQSYKIA